MGAFWVRIVTVGQKMTLSLRLPREAGWVAAALRAGASGVQIVTLCKFKERADCEVGWTVVRSGRGLKLLLKI